jgi:hypothetical protein
MIRAMRTAPLHALVLLLAGCSSGSDEGGFGVPKQPADAPLDGGRVTITGTVVVQSNGCIALDTGVGEPRWIVWPADQEDDMGQPVLDGRVVADGDRLRGTGTQGPADVLPDWSNADSYFASYGTFCAAEETGIVALDDVARA